MAVVVVEGDDEKEGVKEGERDGTTKQAKDTERVGLARLYYQSIHGKVIDKLAQFSSLKELRLGEDCSRYGTGNGDGGSLVDSIWIWGRVKRMAKERSRCL